MMNRQSPGADTEPVDQCVLFRHPEAELLRLYGSHSLAFFGLAEDVEQFLAPGEQGLIAYRLVNRVAVALGDPLCAPQAVEAVTRSFLAFCRAQGFRVAFYQARPDYLAIYHTLHLHAFKMGEEAMLFPQTFSLQGPALAKVRTRCLHAQREGVQIQWYEGVLPAAVMQQLFSISDAWLESKGGRQAEETGFSTGKCSELQTNARRADRLTGLLIPSHGALPALPLVTGVALTRSGQACAFVTFTPIYGVATGEEGTSQRWGWALDLMRRTADAPSGAMDLLLVQALERFRARGAHTASLALVALADRRLLGIHRPAQAGSHSSGSGQLLPSLAHSHRPGLSRGCDHHPGGGAARAGATWGAANRPTGGGSLDGKTPTLGRCGCRPG